jgi:hypothetical protein
MGEGEMFRTTHHNYLDHNRLCIDLYHALTEPSSGRWNAGSSRTLYCIGREIVADMPPLTSVSEAPVWFKGDACLLLPFVPLCFGIQWNPCTQSYRAFVYIARVVGR